MGCPKLHHIRHAAGECDSVAEVDTPRDLFVAMYPYIPDANHDNFTAMTERIKREFETVHPDVNLTVAVSDTYDTYDMNNIPKVFSSDGPQVVEVDLSLLGYLVDGGFVSPIRYTDPDLFGPAIVAASVDGCSYAIPTWMCSEFLYSRNPAILNATTSDEMLKIITEINPEGKVKLVGDFQGGWTLPGLYVVGYVDNYGYDLVGALSSEMDNQTGDMLIELMDDCNTDGENKCLNKYYHHNSTEAAKVFARGDATSFMGFSERMFDVLSYNSSLVPGGVNIISAKFGNSSSSSNSIMWVDGLVLNANRSDEQSRRDAINFSQYINKPETREWIAFSRDNESGTAPPPRYLMPATRDFYQLQAVLDDPYYPQFESILEYAMSFPNKGFPEIREEKYNQVCSYIQVKIPNTTCD